MSASKQKSRSLLPTSTLYSVLKDDILTGKLPPGKKLILKDLSKQYMAGNSPLREALTRLSSVGMVVKKEGRGFCVAPAGVAEFRELAQTRCLIGEIALRDSMANGDEEWEDRIVVAFHRLQKAPLSSEGQDLRSRAEWENRHRNFHTALISACGSGLLCDFAEQLQTRAERFRNLAEEVVRYRDQYEQPEHLEIKDAVLSGDVELSIELLKKHYTATLEVYEKYVQSRDQ